MPQRMTGDVTRRRGERGPSLASTDEILRPPESPQAGHALPGASSKLASPPEGTAATRHSVLAAARFRYNTDEHFARHSPRFDRFLASRTVTKPDTLRTSLHFQVRDVIVVQQESDLARHLRLPL